MTEFRIPWSGRSYDYSEQEIAAVVDVMRTGDPLTQGPRRDEFERRFAQYLGVAHAFAVSNCTNAIDLVAVLASVRPGDEVVVPGHTFSASAIPFLRRGAILKFADIDPDTRLVTRDTIARVMSPRTKLIEVVHLYGLMPEMSPIVDLAKERNVQLLEDCAQSIGAEDHGRKAGTFGDFAVFSFHGQKSLTTLGEGGVLVVRDASLAAKTPGLRHNGLRTFARPDDRYWLPAMANVDLDIEGEVPFNFCLGEAQCALATKMLERIDTMNDQRIVRANRFRAAVSDFPELTFQKVLPDKRHVYHLLSAKYEARSATRDDFISRMAFKHGIRVIVQYYPLYRYPLFKRLGFDRAECPQVDHFFDRMVSFPFHHWMSEEDFSYMIDKTRETLATLRDGQ